MQLNKPALIPKPCNYAIPPVLPYEILLRTLTILHVCVEQCMPAGQTCYGLSNNSLSFLHRILSKLFATRVELGAPPEGAAAAKHNARIAQDADVILAADNHRILKTLASAVG